MQSPCEEQLDNITELLHCAGRAEPAGIENLAAAVYPKLRAIARHSFAHERHEHTLQPTALVHEVWLRIQSGMQIRWKDRNHFYSVCALKMRHALVDHGRHHRAARRGCGLRVSMEEFRSSRPDNKRQIELLEELLRRLKSVDPVAAQVVEMKFIAGLTDEEAAKALGCSRSTVKRHWTFARAWLASHANE